MPSAPRDTTRLTGALALSIAAHLAFAIVLPLRDRLADFPSEVPAPTAEVVVATAVPVAVRPPLPPVPVAPRPFPDANRRPEREEVAAAEVPEPEPSVPVPLPEPIIVPLPEPEPEPEAPPEPAPQPPQPTHEQAPSVDQFDWNDVLDPLAGYLGERDNRVEEQTVAAITSLEDEARTPEVAERSEAEEAIVEDGAEEPSRVERESVEERVAAAAATPQPTVATPAQPEVEPDAEAVENEPRDEAPAAPAPAVANEPRVEPAVVPPVELEPVAGGAVPVAPPANPLDAFGLSGAVDRARQAASDGPTTRMVREAATSNSASYLEVFGERDGVDGEALARVERQESFAGDHEERWEHTRAALENFDVAARTGTETHLSTMSDPFAAYIHMLHNKIHPLWSGYLSWIDFGGGSDGRLADPTLVVELEYVIRSDGTVEEVNIVRGSGVTEFDAQAIDLLWNIGPHDAPPASMVSPTGFVYIHWEFHRDERMCWTGGASVRMVTATE